MPVLRKRRNIASLIKDFNNMKKLFIIAYSLLVASFASAQNMREIWLSMPDSLVPYLNNSLRTEVADYVDMKDMKP